MKEDHPQIRFVLIGDGPEKNRLRKESEARRLSNTLFLPSQPMKKIPDFINAADVTLAPLRTPQIRGTVPVKIYDSMACGVPVITCATGEAKWILEDAKAGVAVGPGNEVALREAIISFVNDPRMRVEMGKNGREAAVQKYSRARQAQQLSELLEGL
jgi:glycosyltransferase involved in cell wall biosynthesis